VFPNSSKQNDLQRLQMRISLRTRHIMLCTKMIFPLLYTVFHLQSLDWRRSELSAEDLILLNHGLVVLSKDPIGS
jgi:hypothetical protein